MNQCFWHNKTLSAGCKDDNSSYLLVVEDVLADVLLHKFAIRLVIFHMLINEYVRIVYLSTP